MDRQRRGESLDVKPSARAALVQLEPAERGEPADRRILDTDRSSDEAITDAVEAFPPYLGDERRLDRESEEGRRRVAANPEGKTPVSDVNATMRDRA
jgi:hypothetical protein